MSDLRMDREGKKMNLTYVPFSLVAGVSLLCCMGVSSQSGV